MSSRNKKIFSSRGLWFIVAGFFVFTLAIVAFANFYPVPSGLSTVSAIKDAAVPSQNSLLQFTSQGTVIGFQNTGIIVASPTHMLRVDFVNSNSVAPESAGGGSAAPESLMTLPNSEKAAPLTKVTYRNVWNGIDITYEASKDSLMKSTYFVNLKESDKSISSNNIILKYNRPLSLDKNKNLVIKYDLGTITESAPLAWQIINDKKVPVPISFLIKSQYEVGFTLGKYTPNIPIIIDPIYKRVF
ncbi:MAG: hypothetical protein NT155_02905 [Candidatus Staskawiczbacteria bacterium]|nr:hypothetical protein [Candidatus Staskawiczbacteria bacterium]